MDADLFAAMVEKLAFTRAVKVTMESMASPPGRIPEAELVELSHWFNELNAEGEKMVTRAVALAAGQAVLTFLCILDGAQAIEAGPDKGHLELLYVKGDTRILLNDRRKEPLNDKFHWHWPATGTKSL